MRTLFCNLAIFVSLCATSNATNYYFSTATGNDSRSAIQAQNPSTPWKTISKLNSYINSIQAGDSILFNRGEIFAGTIKITRSGTAQKPIVFAAYGDSKKNLPIISGLTTLTNWVNKGNGIWETPCSSCKTEVNNFLVNGAQKPMGRYPNSNAANKGYLNYESHDGTTQITDDEFNEIINYSGGELVIRPNRWVIDRDYISEHSGNSITFVSASGYEPIDNFGYFIQNHLKTLDQFGEWFYDKTTKNMSFFFGTTAPTTVTTEVSVFDTLIYINNQSFINFSNLNFKGANMQTFKVSGAKNIAVTNCVIQFSGIDAITATSTSDFKIEDNTILNTNSNAVNLYYNCTNASIRNNVIRNVGVDPGMGRSGNNTSEGIVISGNNNTVEYNTVDSTGYAGIEFGGNSVNIKNNFINHFTLTKDDGGGIYTWIGGSNATKYSDRNLIGNIIINGIGAGAGSDDPTHTLSEGIYMDDNTSFVNIIGNTIANCGGRGIFLHNSHDVVVNKNTIYNNEKQLSITHDDICDACVITNNKVYSNTLFSKTVNQYLSDIRSIKNDIAGFARFDSNYYCRPMDDNLAIYNSFVDVTTARVDEIKDLQIWQSSFATDLSSKKSPFTIPYYTTNTIGSNKFSNGSFNTDVSGVSSYSNSNNVTATWNKDKLDRGALQVAFSSTTKSVATVYMSIADLKANKKYILKFSAQGTKDNKTISLYLRQNQSPYNYITNTSYCKISKARSENEFLFSSNTDETNTRLCFEVDQKDSTLWLDNIQIFEASVTMTNPDDYMRFEYNPTKVDKVVSLPATYYDSKNKVYTGNITLPPFTSLVLIKKATSPNSGVLTPVDNSTQAFPMTIYPNPAQQGSDVKAKIEGFTDNNLLVIVYDIFGRELYSKVAVKETDGYYFSVDNEGRLPAGIYVVIGSANDRIYKQKLVVK